MTKNQNLSTLIVRTNFGRAVISHGRSLKPEIISNVEWFLNDFENIISYETSEVGMNNRDAFIADVRRLFPKHLIFLDYWNSNTSQFTNLKAFMKGADAIKRWKSLNKNMYKLRTLDYKEISSGDANNSWKVSYMQGKSPCVVPINRHQESWSSIFLL